MDFLNKYRMVIFNIIYFSAIAFIMTGAVFDKIYLTIIGIVLLMVVGYIFSDTYYKYNELLIYAGIVYDLYNLKVVNFTVDKDSIVNYKSGMFSFSEDFNDETNDTIFQMLNKIVEKLFVIQIGYGDYNDVFFLPENPEISKDIYHLNLMLGIDTKLILNDDYMMFDISQWLMEIMSRESNGYKLGLNYMKDKQIYEIVLYKD